MRSLVTAALMLTVLFSASNASANVWHELPTDSSEGFIEAEEMTPSLSLYYFEEVLSSEYWEERSRLTGLLCTPGESGAPPWIGMPLLTEAPTMTKEPTIWESITEDLQDPINEGLAWGSLLLGILGSAKPFRSTLSA